MTSFMPIIGLAPVLAEVIYLHNFFQRHYLYRITGSDPRATV